MHTARDAKFFAKSIGNNARYLKSIEIKHPGQGFKTHFADFIHLLESAKHLEVLRVPGGFVGRVDRTVSYSPDRFAALIAPLLRFLRDTQRDQMPRRNRVTSGILVMEGPHAPWLAETLEAGATDPCHEVKKLLAQALGENLMEAV